MLMNSQFVYLNYVRCLRTKLDVAPLVPHYQDSRFMHGAMRRLRAWGQRGAHTGVRMGPFNFL